MYFVQRQISVALVTVINWCNARKTHFNNLCILCKSELKQFLFPSAVLLTVLDRTVSLATKPHNCSSSISHVWIMAFNCDGIDFIVCVAI